MKSYVIHLIRHGAIDETLSGKYIGVTDPSLSDKGRAALKKLVYTYAYPNVTTVFSSPLKRCTETCRILFPSCKPLLIADLGECHFGDWEGKTAAELTDDETFRRWLAGDNSVKPPHGESNDAFVRRICKIFERIVEGLVKTGTTECAVVTHGGVMSTLLAVYGLPQAKPFEWAAENGCGYSVRVTPMLWQRGKVTEVFSRCPVARDEED